MSYNPKAKVDDSKRSLALLEEAVLAYWDGKVYMEVQLYEVPNKHSAISERMKRYKEVILMSFHAQSRCITKGIN